MCDNKEARRASFFVWSLISVNSIPNVTGRKRTYNKEKHEALAIASKEKGLEVNADKTKYLIVSRNHNTGKNHNIILIINPLKGCNISEIWEQP